MQDSQDRIPSDVLLEIVSHLGPPLTYIPARMIPTMDALRHQTLRDLVLVCREYYHNLLPFLFQTIYVDWGLNSANLWDEPLRFGNRFSRSVADGDERAGNLAPHVRTYIIVNSPPALQRGTNQDLNLSSFKALASFRNLREVQSYGLSVTTEFLSAVASLPPLQVLRLEQCSVPKPLEESLLRKFSTLRVIHIYTSVAGFWEGDTQSQRLFRHYYPVSHTKYLTGRSTTNFYLLNALATSHSSMDHLEHVKFATLQSNEAHPRALTNFLKMVLNLKTLHIEQFENHTDNHEDFDNVPGTIYPTPPKLGHLHAHLRALMAMIPGSSVSSIGIAGEDIWPQMPMPIYDEKGPHFWRPYAEAFTKSRKPIISMDVPMDLYTSVHFARYFPSLRTLTIRPKPWNWYNVNGYDWTRETEDPVFVSGLDEIIALFLAAWDLHPELTELRFLYDHVSIILPVICEQINTGSMTTIAERCEVSENTLNTLRKRIPTLKWVTFLNQQPPNHDGGQAYQISVQ